MIFATLLYLDDECDPIVFNVGSHNLWVELNPALGCHLYMILRISTNYNVDFHC
jgi:hypothetical protein